MLLVAAQRVYSYERAQGGLLVSLTAFYVNVVATGSEDECDIAVYKDEDEVPSGLRQLHLS
jgi:hypothetical protein